MPLVVVLSALGSVVDGDVSSAGAADPELNTGPINTGRIPYRTRVTPTTITTAADFREEPDHWPIVQSTGASKKVSTRTLRRWIADAAAAMVEQTDDDGWAQLSFHDLRRSWATNLAAAGVDPILVLDVGGWSDLETFLDHYRGSYSPEAHRRERQKVDWL